jgi:hypothetical protein
MAPSDLSSPREALLDLANAAPLTPGDVLLTRTADVAGLERIARSVTDGDTVMQRDRDVRDIYVSSFADALLEAAGADRSQHFQIRKVEAFGTTVLQMAAYPTPPISAGVRLWCDSAIVWLFVPRGRDGDEAVNFFRRLQPLWERVRAHHGVPMDRALPEELSNIYPVPYPVAPMTKDERAQLVGAVDFLSSQSLISDIVDRRTNARKLVDDVLLARQTLVRHLDRMKIVLEHAHGTARSKVLVMRQTAYQLAPDEDPIALEHLLAPHEHLIDGMEETQRNLDAVLAAVSTTASLITTAAVGRLLDRSKANRTMATAVATAAFCAAILSTYTALAAIPRDGRAIPDLVRLSGWVGSLGITAGLGAYAVAALAAVPSHRLPSVLRVRSRLVLGTLAVSSTAAFVVTAVSGWWQAAVGGGVLLALLIGTGALVNDY